MKIEVYSDGSATVATKPGGYGYVIVVEGVKIKEGSGHMLLASNNDAELEGAIQGLAQVVREMVSGTIPSDQGNEVTLVSDSEIILNWASGAYRFKQKAKLDKYNQLMQLMTRLKAKTRWVEGHTGDEHNERCDKLANAARKQEVDNSTLEIKPNKIQKKKKSSLNVLLEVEIDHSMLYSIHCDAARWANSGSFKPFTNDWTVMFTDKAKELMEQQADKIYSLGVKK